MDVFDGFPPRSTTPTATMKVNTCELSGLRPSTSAKAPASRSSDVLRIGAHGMDDAADDFLDDVARCTEENSRMAVASEDEHVLEELDRLRGELAESVYLRSCLEAENER